MNLERSGQHVNLAPEDFAAGNSSTSTESFTANNAVDVIGDPKKNPKVAAFTRTRQYARISEVFGHEGESVPDTLRRLFVVEGCSMRQFGKGVHLDRKTVVSILDEHTIPRKIKGSVEYEQWRLSKVRDFWQDPVNRKNTLALIHTTASDVLRSSSMKKHYEENPDVRDKVGKRAKTIGIEKRAALCKELFGTEDLKVVLGGFISSGLDRHQIAEKFGKTPATISVWIKDLGIRNEPRPYIGKERRDEYERRRTVVSQAKDKGLFQSLTERQKQVLDLLYGENGIRPTLREAQEEIGVSKQRSYQLSQAAFGSLDRLARGESIKCGHKITELPFEKMGDNPSETLVSWYEDEGLSTLDIGNRLGCSHHLVLRLLHEIEVEVRKPGPRKGVRFENNDEWVFFKLPEEIAQINVSEINFGLANSIMLRYDLVSLSVGELSAMSDDELMSLKGFGIGKVNSIRGAIAQFVQTNKK